MRIPSLDANSQKELSSLTEEHLTLLVREAVAVQRHCKRARIHLPATTGNTTAAVVNQTAAHAGGGILKRRLHAEDINMALQWRGSEKIYATSSAVSAISSSSSSAKSSNHSLHRDIKKIMLEDYLKTEMDTPPPQEVGLTVHWLAVDGVQPDIPQNPSRPAAPVEPSTGLASVSKRSKRSDVVHEIEADDEGDPDNVPSAAGLVDPVLSTATGATVRMGQLSSNLGLTVGDSTASVQVAQLLPRVVSEELRLYYGRITTVVDRVAETGMMREEQDAALTRLAQDAGIQELVPFLLQFVAQRLFQNTFDSSHGRVLVRMARSLLRNPHLHLEIHVRSKEPS
jgi:transcription initiation factor TFIID subunit 6